MKGIKITRNDDGSLDEIVATSANVHLEQMDASTWWLCITQGKQETRTYLTSRSRIKTSSEITGIPRDGS
jgi:hypothetical protein